jgi:hypothetical protein
VCGWGRVFIWACGVGGGGGGGAVGTVGEVGKGEGGA